MGASETTAGAPGSSDQGQSAQAEGLKHDAPSAAGGEASGGQSAGKAAAPKKGNLGVRLLTAGTLGPLVLVLLFAGPSWGWAVFITLSAGQVARELLRMTHPLDAFSRWVGAFVTACVTGGLFFAHGDTRVVVSVLGLAVLTMPLLTLVRLGDLPTAALRLLAGLATPLYIGVTMGCLALLRTVPDGPAFVFLTLTIGWMGDTGGYTLGRMIGKTPLYPQVSPKKTKEGLLGSVLFSTGAAIAASLTYLPQLPLLSAALLGACGALLGQAGDLVESLLKRSTGVKDSGSILPGHGGLFDRVDALLVVSLLVYVYTLWA